MMQQQPNVNANLNMALMGGQQPQVMAPTLFPNGIGITDRMVEDPESCSCPPCFCWTRPMWFTDSRWQQKGQESGWTPKCSGLGFFMNDADLLGHKVTFEGRECCGVETCYEPEIIVSEGGRELGKTIMKMPCCACGETVMAESKDATGNPRFQRIENVWCPQYRYWSGSICGWQEYNWPVFPAQGGRTVPPSAHITFRYHCCIICRPIWVGVRQFPMGISDVDQKLLVSMAICRLWRAEREQQQEQGAGTN